MGNEVSLCMEDIRGGAPAVSARLRARTASPNKRMLFPEDVGPLPRGCKCTPLGYALLAGDAALRDVLLTAGADPRKPVGLPHRFDFTPLQLACALGQTDSVRKLLAVGADPNAPLQLKRETTARLASPAHSTSLLPVSMVRARPGDAPLHIAIDCAGSATGPGAGRGGVEALVEALLGHVATDPNLPTARKRTPLYKAVKRRLPAVVTLLATHPRVDVDAGGALFAAITAESNELVRVLLQAGAATGGRGVRNDAGLTPLRYALTRPSLFFHNRAEIVALLLHAGAAVEPDMVGFAEQRKWRRVQRALEAGVMARHEAAEATARVATPEGASAGIGGASWLRATVSPLPQPSPAVGSSPGFWSHSGGRVRMAGMLARPAAAPPVAAGRSAGGSAALDEREGTRGSSNGSAASRPAATVPPPAVTPASTDVTSASNGADRRPPSSAPGRSAPPPRSSSQPGSAAFALLDRMGRNPLSALFLPVVAPVALLLGLADALVGSLAALRDMMLTVFWCLACVAVFCAPAALYGLHHLVVQVAWMLRVLAAVCLSCFRLLAPAGGAAAAAHANLSGSGTVTLRGSGNGHERECSLGFGEATAPEGVLTGMLRKAAAAVAVGGPSASEACGQGSPSLAAPHMADSNLAVAGDLAAIAHGALGGGFDDRRVVLPPRPGREAPGCLAEGVPGAEQRLGADPGSGLDFGAGYLVPAKPGSRVVGGEAVLELVWRIYLGFFVALAALLLAATIADALLRAVEGLLRRYVPHSSPARTAAALQPRRPRGWGYMWCYLLVALGLRWFGCWSFWALSVLHTACFVVHGLVAVWTGYEEWAPRGERQASHQAVVVPEVDAGALPATDGAAGDVAAHPGDGPGSSAAAGSPEEAVTGGLDGLCCVCMSARAVMGFVHGDVVHCCMCAECQAEIRRRGQGRVCLICKRPASSVARVVVT